MTYIQSRTLLENHQSEYDTYLIRDDTSYKGNLNNIQSRTLLEIFVRIRTPLLHNG